MFCHLLSLFYILISIFHDQVVSVFSSKCFANITLNFISLTHLDVVHTPSFKTLNSGYLSPFHCIAS